MIEKLNNILNKKVKRLFLIVWPPYAEEKSQIDISVGIVFEDYSDKFIVISTDKDDLTSTIIYFEKIPDNYYKWNDYFERMNKWMENNDDSLIFKTEYYDVTDAEVFKNIIDNKIVNVFIINEKGGEKPLGIKIEFEKDFVISTPIIDGNTIETRYFNKNNNLKKLYKYIDLELNEIKNL